MSGFGSTDAYDDFDDRLKISDREEDEAAEERVHAFFLLCLYSSELIFALECIPHPLTFAESHNGGS